MTDITAAELIKVESNYLAGTIGAELANDAAKFDADAETLLKFHGIYQQDDRDIRRERAQQKLPLDYSCMVRASVPGGVITSDQWLALDRVASLADNKLRLTTRQGVQFHVVHKGELAQLVSGINSSLLTTLGACGDVVRNIMACPLPHAERSAAIEPIVAEMVARFRPQTESYWELWVDGEQAVSSEKPSAAAPAALDAIDTVEPIYGAAYLPRKFKIGIAWPGDNCVDIYTHDVGIVPTLDGPNGLSGNVTGFVILAGGGMGMSHARPDDTYPVLAQPVGWVPAAGRGGVESLGDVVEAIVTTQRDHGNRDDRARARLKYLVEAKGIPWLRDQIELRTGQSLFDPVDLPEWEVHAHHGWDHIGPIDAEPNTKSSVLGLPVPSGKVAHGLRYALKRLIVDGAVTALRVTPRQDLAAARHHGPGRRGEHLALKWCAARERPEPDTQPGDRLPGSADLLKSARRGGARAAAGRRPPRESVGRHGQHRAAAAAQHDWLPQRLLAALCRRTRHRRPDQGRLRRLRRWFSSRRPTCQTRPGRRAPRGDPRHVASTARTVQPRYRPRRRHVVR
jgi:sulfite reductase (ferredoxin)